MNNKFKIEINSCGIPLCYMIEDKVVNISGDIELSEVEALSIGLAIKKYKDVYNNFKLVDYFSIQNRSLECYFSRIYISKNNRLLKEIIVDKDGYIIEESNFEQVEKKEKTKKLI